jgi:hypothetical protein
MAVKKNILRLGFTAIIVALVLLFPSCSCNKTELLGDTQIVVYQKGEKKLLDPQSSNYGELQAVCEEMLISCTTFLTKISTLPDSEEVKQTEYLIELNYSESIIVTIPRLGGSTDVGIGGNQLLIPLTGRLTDLESTLEDREIDNKYVHILLLPENMGFPSEIVEGEAELVGTKMDIQEIKDILNRFDINVP